MHLISASLLTNLRGKYWLMFSHSDADRLFHELFLPKLFAQISQLLNTSQTRIIFGFDIIFTNKEYHYQNGHKTQKKQWPFLFTIEDFSAWCSMDSLFFELQLFSIMRLFQVNLLPFHFHILLQLQSSTCCRGEWLYRYSHACLHHLSLYEPIALL